MRNVIATVFGVLAFAGALTVAVFLLPGRPSDLTVLMLIAGSVLIGLHFGVFTATGHFLEDTTVPSSITIGAIPVLIFLIALSVNY